MVSYDDLQAPNSQAHVRCEVDEGILMHKPMEDPVWEILRYERKCRFFATAN